MCSILGFFWHFLRKGKHLQFLARDLYEKYLYCKYIFKNAFSPLTSMLNSVINLLIFKIFRNFKNKSLLFN